jgi:citryl-CoA lyase
VIAAITVAMGFTPEESTALAILGTLPGVIAHISEEFASRKVQRLIPPVTVDYDVPRRDLAIACDSCFVDVVYEQRFSLSP